MQIPLQVTFRGIERSEALQKRIHAGVASLERFHPRITSCRVTVEQQDHHRHQGRLFGVNVEIRVPGRKEIVSTLQRDEDVYVALRDAFDAVQRRLAAAEEPQVTPVGVAKQGGP